MGFKAYTTIRKLVGWYQGFLFLLNLQVKAMKRQIEAKLLRIVQRKIVRRKDPSHD
jgi:hypothetical protein